MFSDIKYSFTSILILLFPFNFDLINDLLSGGYGQTTGWLAEARWRMGATGDVDGRASTCMVGGDGL